MPNPALYAPVFGVSQLQTNPDRQAERRVAAQLPLPMSFFALFMGACVVEYLWVCFNFIQRREKRETKIRIA